MCDQLISAAQQGSPVDWSLLPSANAGSLPDPTPKIEPRVEKTKEELPKEPTSSSVPTLPIQEPPADAAPAPVADIPIPRTTLEALEQRLAKYQSIQQQAQEEGNSSKARRLGRIVKQYQDAIKLNKTGKPVPFDELPDPPGIIVPPQFLKGF